MGFDVLETEPLPLVSHQILTLRLPPIASARLTCLTSSLLMLPTMSVLFEKTRRVAPIKRFHRQPFFILCGSFAPLQARALPAPADNPEVVNDR